MLPILDFILDFLIVQPFEHFDHLAIHVLALFYRS